jgi:hypothetical protein
MLLLYYLQTRVLESENADLTFLPVVTSQNTSRQLDVGNHERVSSSEDIGCSEDERMETCNCNSSV